MHFAVAVGGVHRGRNGARHHGGMEHDAEFPAVRQVDSNHVTRADARGDEPARCPFNQVSVLRVSEAAVWRTGSIHDGELIAVLSAGVKNDIVNELAFRVGVEVRAYGRDW